MAHIQYDSVPHDHEAEAFLKKARKREDFRETYDGLEEEYLLVCEMLSERAKSRLTQEAVAELMGNKKNAVWRLESAGKHAPSITTLKRYAKAVGCDLQGKSG
jgi:DNA-binding XRE family transcriptional regulator